MRITRRNAMKMLTAAAATTGLVRPAPGAAHNLEIAKGPFQGTRESLEQYETPEWFRDAKFGLWAHWGPQSGVEDGDWYARNMYIQGSDQYNYHVAHYGHQSKVGFKDLIPQFKAAHWDPEHLISLYKAAGAKYFVSMGAHHDNFDMWNSKYQPRWNAKAVGPKRDIVGEWAKAARAQGLRFGVTEHLWITYKWFTSSHGADKTGPLAGVPYDGQDKAYSDLYTSDTTVYVPKLPWNSDNIPDSWRYHWYQRIKDLVDNYHPDLLYTDGPLPFEEYGLNIVANLYNLSAQRNGGKVDAVYNSKRQEDCTTGTCVLDVERGVVDQIWPKPWQTDTCIGDWHYKRGIKYKTGKTVIDLLCDIVSRNGNLLLNIPLPNSGVPDDQELAVVADITKWMSINSEGIYSTRPWKIFGEGPSTHAIKSGSSFNEKNRKDLTAEDVRFTTKQGTLYAFVMGVPTAPITIQALALGGAQNAGKIQNVEMLGYGGKLKWHQTSTGLTIQTPAEKPSEHATAFKVMGAI
ncbi:MAG: alpha-L-fucosidase [Bryobacteraceae bacterium]